MVKQQAIKQEYNANLERYKRAVWWIDKHAKTLDDLDPRIKAYKDIGLKLSALLTEIGEYTHKEAIEGFAINQ